MPINQPTVAATAAYQTHAMLCHLKDATADQLAAWGLMCNQKARNVSALAVAATNNEDRAVLLRQAAIQQQVARNLIDLADIKRWADDSTSASDKEPTP